MLSPVTGKPMIRDVRPVTISYKNHSATVQLPGWYGEDPEDTVHVGDDLREYGRAIRALKIEVDHLLTPEEVRRIRTKLGLTQRDAGLIIGGGPNAFQKYESGEILVSRLGANLLRILDEHPEYLNKLKEEAYA